jgi:hypothetical protein
MQRAFDLEQEIKSVSENWGSLFESELKRAERESIKDFRDYYSSQYNKASAQFILTRNLNQADLSAYFQNNDLQNMYRDMYEKIGLRFANWYAKHWDKALAKATDINGYQSIWQAKFAYIGEQVGAQRVTLVSGTAKETLIKITQQAMRDPQFMALGDREKARILRSKFDRYSDYQARRLVRTESTNAANFATMQSASDIFPAQEMNKTWITAIDGRERDAHHSANRQTVQFTKPFIVGGESLMHPGDSNGSAGNVINCRCSVAPIPKPNAQTIGTAITDIGFGMAQAQVQSVISSAFITPEVAAVVATEVAVVNEQSLIDKMRPDNWNDIVPADAVVDDSYLGLLQNKPKMLKSIKGSSYMPRTNELEIDLVRFDSSTIPSVLAHEFGHAIHIQNGWITSFHSDAIVDFYFKKHQKIVGIGLRGDARMEKLRKAYYQLQKIETIEFRNKYSYLSDNQYLEYRGQVNDFFGALTKNKIGWGHDTSYYRLPNRNKMEWMAHIFENKYAGNPLFKELFPNIYDETITILDELIATIK